MTATSRKLGKTGIEIAPLVFGGNIFGWTVDEPTSFKLLDAFVAAGFNMIDTADIYSRWVTGNKGGESETIIGKWFKRSGKRSQVILATKVGMEMGETSKGLSKKYILQAVEDSLSRLQTDRIDLYQSHKDDEATSLEETLDAFAQLIKQGKVRSIGASNYSAERLTKSLDVAKSKSLPGYQCLQPHYNLCERELFEKDLEAVCVENGLGVIPYFSLASGFLTGKYRSEQDLGKSLRGGGMKKYLNDRGQRILQALDHVSRRFESKPSRVALAWLLARPSITAPIASATNLEQLDDLIESTRLSLDAEAIESLNQASAW